MHIKYIILRPMCGLLLGSITLTTHAAAFSFSNVFVDAENLQFSSGIMAHEPELESYIILGNDKGDTESYGSGDYFYFDSLDMENTAGSAGAAYAPFYDVSVFADSSVNDYQLGFASSELSILFPFYNDVLQDLRITADYGFFGSVEVNNAGEYAAAGQSLFMSILDEDFSQIGIGTEKTHFLEAYAGSADEIDFLDQAELFLGGVAQGNYYVAFDLASDAYAESVPAPGTLFLALLGLGILWRMKATENYDSQRLTDTGVNVS